VAFAESSVCIRLVELFKPDCRCDLQRKRRESLPAAVRWPLSPVRFDNESCGIAAISGGSQKNPAKILCKPDCVAERAGFEPSVPFLAMPLRAHVSVAYCDSVVETSGPEKRNRLDHRIK
jgi:hypothetical protein